MKKVCLLLLLAAVIVLETKGQVSTSSNFSINTGDYVGWDNNVTFPLNIEHRADDEPIRFITTTAGFQPIQRMVITHDGINPRIGIGGNPLGSNIWPASQLHVGIATAATSGYRAWMETGTFFGGSGFDNMYVGLREIASDENDAIVNWGNNPTTFGNTDRLRFVFTANTGLGDGVADQVDGLEVARMMAINTGTQQNPVIEPRMGIGNFFTPGLDPEFTLDVNGQASIRDVQQNDQLNQVLVRDPNDFGRIIWRDASTLGGLIGADNGLHIDAGTGEVYLGGTLVQNTTIDLDNHNLIFSYSATNPTHQFNNIGIGTTNPVARLQVSRTQTLPMVWHPVGMIVENTDVSDPGQFLGIASGLGAVANGDNRENRGVSAAAHGALNNYGLYSFADAQNTGSTAVGAYASGSGGTGSNFLLYHQYSY